MARVVLDFMRADSKGDNFSIFKELGKPWGRADSLLDLRTEWGRADLLVK